MPKRKAKKVKKKITQAKPHRHNKNDWIRMAGDFNAFTGTLAAFCTRRGLNYNTARKHLRIKDRSLEKEIKKREKLGSTKDEFLQRIKSITGDSDKIYNKAIAQSLILIEEIMIDSGAAFKQGISDCLRFGTLGEAARVAIQASTELRSIALEKQGIPDDGENFGWPMTKGFHPHSYQRDFIFDTPETLKAETGRDVFIFAFIGGVGSGKTRCGAEKFGDLCWRNRGSQLGMFAPTYRMLHDTTMRMFFEVLTNKGISWNYKASTETITIFGDTPILCRSMDNPEHYRGIEIAAYWMDEIQQLANRNAFDLAQARIRSTDETTEKAGLITATSNGFNWFYDVLVEEGEKNKVKIYHAETSQNYLLGKEYHERLMSLYDDRFAQQELCAKFIDVFAGQAYWNFKRSHSLNDDIELEKNLPLILMFDLNVDPMCWNVGQQRRHREGFDIDIILDEIHINTASTEEACKEFISRYKGHKAGVHVYGDSTSRNKSTATTRTDYKIIEDMLQKEFANVEFFIGRSNPAVTNRITAMNARLKTMDNERRLFVNSRCRFTIKDFERVGFKPGTRELDKTDPELTHHTDAIGYYIYKQYPVKRPKMGNY